MQGKDKLPLEDFSGTLPFATIADFAPEGNYANREIGYSNTVSIVQRLLAPEAIKYNEYGSITLPDGNTIMGGLQVEYYETVSPLLARALAWEFEMAQSVRRTMKAMRLSPLAWIMPRVTGSIFPPSCCNMAAGCFAPCSIKRRNPPCPMHNGSKSWQKG